MRGALIRFNDHLVEVLVLHLQILMETPKEVKNEEQFEQIDHNDGGGVDGNQEQNDFEEVDVVATDIHGVLVVVADLDSNLEDQHSQEVVGQVVGRGGVALVKLRWKARPWCR